MDAEASQAKRSSLQVLEDFTPGSPSTEDIFSDVENLHCLDLEGLITPRRWSLLIEECFPDREYTSVEVQSPPDSRSLTPDLAEKFYGHQSDFLSGFSSSTVCSSNNDENGEKEPLSGQLVSFNPFSSTGYGAKDCSISKPKSSRQKRTPPSETGNAKRSQQKPRAKKSKKLDLLVECAPPPAGSYISNADLTLCEQILSASNNAVERSSSALISLPSGKESHILTERERRKKMNCMFSSLQSLLPKLPPKADKSTVIDEAISYIQSLETTLLNAEANRKARTCPSPSSDQRQPPQASVPSSPSKEKDMDLSFQTLSSPNALLNVCGTDAFVTVSCSSRLSSLESLFSPLENDKLKVLNAHISTSGIKRFFNIHAQVEKCSDASISTFEATFEALSKCVS